MALPTQPYKGARDFYPQDKRLQKYLFSTMRKVAERFGYEEYDAPILEPLELFLAKTGEEIVNEQTYAFKDRADRQVAIRPEMTPSVSRMVAARRQELNYPLRWYSIPNVWRYERPQRGRLREHWQLNIDLFGVEGLAAEHEVILLANAIMNAFGANNEMYTIRLNSRLLTNYLLADTLGLEETQVYTLIKLIDRMHKIDYSEFVGQVDSIFSPSQRDKGESDALLGFLKTNSLDDLSQSIQQHDSCVRLRSLMTLLEMSGLTNVVFDPTVLRGFDYYSDIVFEVFDKEPKNNRSMFGGGRYDGLVGLFGKENVPTVGFGMGDVTLQNFLESHDLLPAIVSETDAYVVLIGDIYKNVQKELALLRRMGLNLAVDISGQKVDKQIKSAVKKEVRFAIFIGENELTKDQYVLKDLTTGKEETHSAQRIVSIIKDYRKK